MSILDAYRTRQPALSFELFPPKTEKGLAALLRHVAKLVEFEPSYITCTYGAGGSTQDRTLEIVAEVHRQFQLPVATHLTCVNRSADSLRDYLREALQRGVENVVALRGDPPEGQEKFQATEGGFHYANELVEMIRGEFPAMGILVAGYPEVHQEAPSREVDLENLKRKVDAGADAIITQLFYDNGDFYRFRDDCAAAGIDVPVIPGLLPIVSRAQIERITSLCGAKLPAPLRTRLEAVGDDMQAQGEVGIEYATEQTADLMEQGVPGIHYYVLNKSEATSRVLGQAMGARS